MEPHEESRAKEGGRPGCDGWARNPVIRVPEGETEGGLRQRGEDACGSGRGSVATGRDGGDVASGKGAVTATGRWKGRSEGRPLRGADGGGCCWVSGLGPERRGERLRSGGHSSWRPGTSTNTVHRGSPSRVPSDRHAHSHLIRRRPRPMAGSLGTQLHLEITVGPRASQGPVPTQAPLTECHQGQGDRAHRTGFPRREGV